MSLKKLLSLKGRKAFVTGSSDGIGKAIALGLAEQGADVIIHARQNESDCQALVKEINAFGVKGHFVLGDIADEKALERMYQNVTAIFNPDILVLNASIQVRKPFLEITREEYDKQGYANFWSTVKFIQMFYPAMQAQGWGRIVTLGSVQQLKPHKDMAIYAGTKSAVMTVVKNLALQFGPHGVTINNLAPGVITTRRNDEALANKEYADLVRSKIPVGFFGEPMDCAGITALLCSDAARYMTGQDIYCDGGMGL
jgi:glucose 1-dehydrogenase